MNDEERQQRGLGTPGTYFLLMPGPRWIRFHPYAPIVSQFRAAVVVKLEEDGTGKVLKDRYHDDNSPWSRDDMIMVSLKAEVG